MLLYELISTTKSISKVPTTFDYKVEKENHFKYPTGGYYAHAEQDKDEHMINRKTHLAVPLQRDPYYAYINYITKHKLHNSNPYFPRAYDIKTEIDNENKIHYDIRMEKLYRLFDFSSKAISVMYAQAFGEESGLNKMTDKDIAKFVDAALCSPESIPPTANKKFKEACILINKLSVNIPANIDMHGSNLMVRMTMYGPQLVITDPLAEEHTST